MLVFKCLENFPVTPSLPSSPLLPPPHHTHTHATSLTLPYTPYLSTNQYRDVLSSSLTISFVVAVGFTELGPRLFDETALGLIGVPDSKGAELWETVSTDVDS